MFFEFNQSKKSGNLNATDKKNSVISKCKSKSKSKTCKNTSNSEEQDDMLLLEKYKYSEDNHLWSNYKDNQVIKNNKKKHQAAMQKKQDEIKLEAYFKYKSNENL